MTLERARKVYIICNIIIALAIIGFIVGELVKSDGCAAVSLIMLVCTSYYIIFRDRKQESAEMQEKADKRRREWEEVERKLEEERKKEWKKEYDKKKAKEKAEYYSRPEVKEKTNKEKRDLYEKHQEERAEIEYIKIEKAVKKMGWDKPYPFPTKAVYPGRCPWS